MDKSTLKKDTLAAMKEAGEKVAYATLDGNIFFQKSLAVIHANQTKQDYITVTDEDSTEENAIATGGEGAGAGIESPYSALKFAELQEEATKRSIDVTGLTAKKQIIELLVADDAKKAAGAGN